MPRCLELELEIERLDSLLFVFVDDL